MYYSCQLPSSLKLFKAIIMLIVKCQLKSQKFSKNPTPAKKVYFFYF